VNSPDRPVILVLGPTASGKSEAAMGIARAVGGEIVSGDAFAVYRGFDVGTAKPGIAARREIPHHLVDVAEPWESYSAGRWAREARRAVEGIESRGAVPVVAGGSHFYIRALLGHLPGDEAADPMLRRYLAGDRSRPRSPSPAKMLALLDPEYASKIGPGDRRRLERGIEIVFSTGRRVSQRVAGHGTWAGRRRWLKIVLQISRGDIYTRVQERILKMFDTGWPEEVAGLLAAGVPLSANAFRAIGYREMAELLRGGITRDEAVERIARRTRELVRRQSTWLSREPDVKVVEPAEAAPLAQRFCEKRGVK
jgi:tRNA dimethylallyltransferase